MSKSTASWFRSLHWPANANDRFIGVSHFTGPGALFEFAEVILSEGIGDGRTSSNKYMLSTLVNSAATKPMEADFGAGRFRRPNEPGRLLLTKAGIPQVLKGVGPFHTVVLYVPKQTFDERMSAMTEGANIDLSLLHSDSFQDDGIRVLMSEMLRRFQTNETERLALEEIFDALCRRLLALTNVKRAEPGEDQRLSRLSVTRTMEFMRSHLNADLSLDTLADVAGVSCGHFARLFKQTLGVTPKQYLLNLQISRAKELLRSPDGHSLKSVAEECGFFDRAHFGKVFLREVGVTPGLYRKHAN